ncbi:glycosyltransferase [Demequina sp. NBRC 110056]|uniref:glycosyltransferase n=1 Tax=Demequina sp. NBRC 110056 TaxID=1570345 RepID=UPI0013563097|nr:glycosyltransferase [Demequina sp. NBRC 110056]
MDILVVASTVPAHADDAVPRFVLDEALALAAADPDVTVRILAPHTPSSRSRPWPQEEGADGRVTQDRFAYAPRRFETLTARGIMPAIRDRRAMALVVPLLVLGERRALRHALRAQRPDVVHAHWFTPQAIVAAGVCGRAGVPFGFTTHAADVAVLRRLGSLGRRIVQRVTGRAAFVTAVSRQTAERLLGFYRADLRGSVRGRIRIAPMGVNIPAVSSVAGDPHTVAVVARLVEKKGIHVLLDAWPAVRAAVPDARLVIGGDGPMRSQLERAAAPLAGVEFRGYVTGDAKAALEAEAGIVAAPSVVAADGDVDGLPVAVLEGLARGAFVVASDASGAQDLLAASPAGAVVRSGDSTALASALIDAMRRGATELAESARPARELADSVSWDVLAPRTLERLRAVAGLPA